MNFEKKVLLGVCVSGANISDNVAILSFDEDV